MASDNNNDNSSFGNFGIQDTMEMGLGNADLLNDLMTSETATGDAAELIPIVKETEDKKPVVPLVPKGKEIVPKIEGEELTGQDLITNFLGDNTEEEIEVIKPPKKEEAKEEHEEEVVKGTQFSALANDLKTLGVFTSLEEGGD